MLKHINETEGEKEEEEGISTRCTFFADWVACTLP